MKRAFKAGAHSWQIGEHFGMSQKTAYETFKRTKAETRVQLAGLGCPGCNTSTREGAQVYRISEEAIALRQ